MSRGRDWNRAKFFLNRFYRRLFRCWRCFRAFGLIGFVEAISAAILRGLRTRFRNWRRSGGDRSVVSFYGKPFLKNIYTYICLYIKFPVQAKATALEANERNVQVRRTGGKKNLPFTGSRVSTTRWPTQGTGLTAEITHRSVDARSLIINGNLGRVRFGNTRHPLAASFPATSSPFRMHP